jgi:hypothetical protein
MPTNTYTPLATVTLSGSDSEIVFASIPNTYRDLILVIQAKSATGNPAVTARFNSDNTANYPYVRMTGSGSGSGGSAIITTDTFLNIAAAFGINTSGNGHIIAQIMDYSATDKHKTVLVRNGDAGLGVEAIAGRWANTNAINTIALANTSSISFASGSTFSLYGVIA